jgi:hypothetical protein
MSEQQDLLPCEASAIERPADRRAHARYPSPHVKTSWRVYGIRAGESWSVTARDISLSGVGLIFNFRLKPGSLLVVKLQSCRRAFCRPVMVRVRHVSSQSDGRWLAGCSFVRKLKEEELQNLL